MKLLVALVGALFLGALAIPLGSTRPASDCGPSCQGSIHPASFSTPLSSPSPQPVRYGAFSLARPPSFRFGVAVGQRDPRAAQEVAEASCRSSPRGCSQIVEFTDACIAVTEGVKRIALVMTSDPRTYEVRGIDHGTASNPADAQEAAMRACQGRERGALSCRVVHSVCGPR